MYINKYGIVAKLAMFLIYVAFFVKLFLHNKTKQQAEHLQANVPAELNLENDKYLFRIV